MFEISAIKLRQCKYEICIVNRYRHAFIMIPAYCNIHFTKKLTSALAFEYFVVYVYILTFELKKNTLFIILKIFEVVMQWKVMHKLIADVLENTQRGHVNGPLGNPR